MRDVIFICHATPEDNEFSIWIASRLEMLGYKTWIDKNGLLGGERFWKTIQKVIKNNAIKILLVYSNHICDSKGELKDGIEKELTYSESIAIQENLSDFIIPLHIDRNAPYNSFIGSNRLIHIPFEDNWAIGLKQLLKKLEQDAVPKSISEENSTLLEWYEKEYISNCSILLKKELFYTSWWQINVIPQEFYIYKFQNSEQAIAIRNANSTVPICLISNILSTFDGNINLEVKSEKEEFVISPDQKYSFSLTDVLSGFESDSFPQYRDVENHFKRLLHCVISNLLRKKNLWKYELSNKRYAYFLPKYNETKGVKFSFPNSTKLKTKSLLGTFEDIGFWHYAISYQSLLSPVVGFSLKSHLVFTTDGQTIISDNKIAHTYRRKKGKRFFNEAWRDLQLAYIQRLKNDDGNIEIQVSTNGEILRMEEWPEMFWSEVGYFDPGTEMDLDIIEGYSEEKIDDEINE